MGWLKRRLPKKRWKRVALCVASTVAILAVVDMGWVQYLRWVKVSVETTRLTGPLNADGMPDYVAVLNAKYGEGVTPENNAAVAMMNLMGTGGMSKEWREKVFPKLGMSPAEVPTRFLDFESWLNTKPVVVGSTLPSVNEAWEEEDKMLMPWKRAEHPVWAKWLESQEDVVQGTKLAAARTRFFIPLPAPGPGDDGADWFGVAATRQYSGGGLQIYGRVRAAAGLLNVHAMASLGDGQAATFEEDMLAEMKWSRLLAQRPALIDYLVGVALQALASQRLGVVCGEAGALSLTSARRLLAAIDSLPRMPSLDTCYDETDRYVLLAELLHGAVNGSARLERDWRWVHDVSRQPDNVAEPQMGIADHLKATFVPVDYERALRDINELEDQAVAALRKPTFRAKMAAVVILERESEANWEKSSLVLNHRPGYALAAESFRSLSKPLILSERAHMQEELARVALALTIYRGEKGGYPEKLEALKEAGILKEVPMDGFTDTALMYRREGAGYVVYSVGEDMKDDGGKAPEKQKHYMEDIVVRAGG